LVLAQKGAHWYPPGPNFQELPLCGCFKARAGLGFSRPPQEGHHEEDHLEQQGCQLG
jgi:hypothetical protein